MVEMHYSEAGIPLGSLGASQPPAGAGPWEASLGRAGVASCQTPGAAHLEVEGPNGEGKELGVWVLLSVYQGQMDNTGYCM